MKLLPAIAIAGLIASAPLFAHAAPIYSMLGQSVGPFGNFNDSSTRWANDFRTGGDAATITAITVAMINTGEIDHNFTLALHEDNAGLPGAVVGVFDEMITIPAVTAPRTDFTATDVGIHLGADTIYWLVIGINENLAFQLPMLAFTDSQTPDAGSLYLPVISTSNLMSLDGGATYPIDSGRNFVFALNGAVVPEPVSFILLVVGAIGVGLFRSQRKLLHSATSSGSGCGT